MKILVDADACPVVKEIESIARMHAVEVVLLCDTSHILQTDYSRVEVISAGAEAVDMALMNFCKRGDVVVTQDYGVAAMVLGKGAFAMHQDGWQYTNDNIERLLMERYEAKKWRRTSGRYASGGQKKRTEKDNEKFFSAFLQMVKEYC